MITGLNAIQCVKIISVTHKLVFLNNYVIVIFFSLSFFHENLKVQTVDKDLPNSKLWGLFHVFSAPYDLSMDKLMKQPRSVRN